MSGFIDFTNIGSWDYYVYANDETTWRLFNAIAAWLSGSGGLLKGAALLGSLILLTSILFNAAITQKASGASKVGVWFIFLCTVGMTGQAKVYNVYTQQINVVDNVPAIALVPASIFSKAAYEILVTIETSQQSVNGSYMSIQQYGSIAPLQLLNRLKSPAFFKKENNLRATLSQVFNDCTYDPNRDYTANPVPPIEKSVDLLQWMTDYGRQSGLTKIYSPGKFDGDIASCADAISYLKNDVFNVYGLPQSWFSYANESMPVKKSGGATWEEGDLESAFRTVANGTNLLGAQQEFSAGARNMLLSTIALDISRCLRSDNGSLTATQSCAESAAMTVDGKLDDALDTTAAGDSFLKRIFERMDAMSAFFLGIFPFIAIYVLVVPHNAGKVLGGYMLLGIWVQSWMVISAPINLYMQNEVQDRLQAAFAQSNGVSIDSYLVVSAVLTSKLREASNLLASVPLLSLALLTGSIFAITGLAKAGTGNITAAPSVRKDVADQAFTGANKTLTGFVAPSSNAAMSEVLASGNAMGTMALTRSAGSPDYNLASTVITNSAQGRSSDKAFSSDKGRTQEAALAANLSTDFKVDRSKAEKIAAVAQASESFRGSVGSDIAKGVSGALSGGLSRLGIKPSAKTDAAINKAVADSQEQSLATMMKSDASAYDKLMGKAGPEVQAETAGKLIDIMGATLTTGAIAVELMSGVGAPAAPATSLAGAALTKVAKETVMAKIKRNAAEAAARGSNAMAAVPRMPEGPGAIEGFAKGAAQGLNASLEYMVNDQTNKTSEGGASASRGTTRAFSASDADKLAKSWRESKTETASNSSGVSQTRTAGVTLNMESVAKMGLEAGAEGRSQLARQTAVMQAQYSPQQVKDAWARVDESTFGRTADNFGNGGKLGAELMQFERNALFQHYLAGTVNQGGLGTLIGNPALSGPRAVDRPITDKVPVGNFGAGVGKSPEFTQAGARHVANGSAQLDGMYNSTKPSLAGNEALVKKHDDQVSDNTDKVTIIAAVDAGAEVAGGLVEGLRRRGSAMQQPASGGSPTSSPAGGQQAPREREPVNQRTRASRAGRGRGR